MTASQTTRPTITVTLPRHIGTYTIILRSGRVHEVASEVVDAASASRVQRVLGALYPDYDVTVTLRSTMDEYSVETTHMGDAREIERACALSVITETSRGEMVVAEIAAMEMEQA